VRFIPFASLLLVGTSLLACSSSGGGSSSGGSSSGGSSSSGSSTCEANSVNGQCSDGPKKGSSCCYQPQNQGDPACAAADDCDNVCKFCK
jgi:hypothetical protein